MGKYWYYHTIINCLDVEVTSRKNAICIIIEQSSSASNAPLRLAYGFGGAYVVGGQGKEGSTSASIEAAAPSF